MNPKINRNPGLFRVTLALITPLALATQASAAVPITVPNAGFESPAIADGGLGSAANWGKIGAIDAGAWNPMSSNYTAEAPEGSNVGYVYAAAAGEGLSQILTATFQADANYSLSVKVGQSKGYPASGYTVQLLADGVVLAEDDNTLFTCRRLLFNLLRQPHL